MSIKTLAIGALLALTVATAIPARADALSLSDERNPIFTELLNRYNESLGIPVLAEPEPTPPEKPPSTEPDPKPAEPIIYKVRSGDNLTKIAESHSTSWLRLWQKNTELENPDLIHVDQVILIPHETEQLAARAVPERVVAQIVASAPQSASGRPQIVPRGSSAGNTYSPGYCTWYVKSRRPGLPNNLGNANTWYSRAAAQGMAVGSTPRAGAVGTTTRGELGHVVYVEAVNSNGTVVISEMNYSGLYSQRTTTKPASDFVYIY